MMETFQGAYKQTPCNPLADHRCFLCVCERVEKLLQAYTEVKPEEKQEFMAEIARRYADHGVDVIPPVFMREAYALMGQSFQAPPPFWHYKKKMNDRGLEMQSMLKAKLRIAGNAFFNGLRIALAGSGANFLTDSREQIVKRIDEVFHKPLALDHSDLLRASISQGTKILYLADGAGEIVFDRLLIRNIVGAEVIYVVNCPYAGYSASGQDADYIDMRKCARVLANGCKAPFTILKHATPQFINAYKEADVIIAKGTSNMEALLPLRDKRLFALLYAKCQVIADYFRVPLGEPLIVNPVARQKELAGDKGRAT